MAGNGDPAHNLRRIGGGDEPLLAVGGPPKTKEEPEGSSFVTDRPRAIAIGETPCYRLISDISGNRPRDMPGPWVYKHHAPLGTSRSPVHWPRSWSALTRCRNTPPETNQTRWCSG